MEEERVKKGAKGRPSTSMSYSGSESESDEMKMVVDSRNEDKSSTAENTAKDDGQEEVEEEEEEEEEEESDEEEEDDEEEEESDDDDDIGVINKKSRKKMTILESESSDDGEGDDCPICLNRLKYQDIGTPEACDHNFCLDCIQLWARNVNTCPVDRREFQLILARHANEDEIFKRIPVSGKSCQNEDDDGDVNQDFTYCELCGRSDREDRLLLCDGCDLGFHCECLDPPLDSVPVEEWFCPDCAEANTQRSGRMLNDLDDMQYLLEENSIDGIPYLRPRRRQIARTRISERVRARIQEYREGLARLVCDDEEPEASDEEGEGPSTRLSRTRSQTRQSEAKRKQSSRKKTKKGTTGKQKSYPKKKLRRRTKTPGKAQIFDRLRNASTSKSPKSRLAGKLGLTKPRMSLRKSDRATAARILKEDLYGAKPLSIMGRKHDLDPFPDDDSHSRLDEPQASTSVFSAAAAKRASKYSASALLSRQPVARPLLCKLPEDNQGSNFFSSHCSNSGASSAASSSGGLDLLGSIMMDQNLLHLESKDVKINRDGSLTAKKAITASAVKEPKKKKQTSTLFFDSKEDENSSGHSDDERNFGSSKVAATAGRRLGGRNNNNNDDNATASQVDCEEKESPEQSESETEMKCSDNETRDSDSETKPSTFESANEMSVAINQEEEEDDDEEEEEEAREEEEGEETQDEDKEEKNESENVEDSFESNEADKAVENDNVEEENEDSCSRGSPAEVGVDSQTSELNDENVSPQKEDADQSYNSEAEDENEEEDEDKEEEEGEEEENEEEEEDDEKVTYKDDDLSEHMEEGEEKAASEVGSSGFSPAPSGSPGAKSRDAEQNSDAEDAKEEEEFLSDEEAARKDAVEKMDESAEVSESVQDEQQAVSDADDTEDENVTGKEEDDEDSAKSDAEEIKDADESGAKSDAEDKDAEMEVKSDAEDKDAELEVKSDAEDKDAELEVKSDAEDKDAELEVKSDAEDKDAELEVKSDAEDKDAELEVKSDAEDKDTELEVKSDAEDKDAEVEVKSDAEDLDTQEPAEEMSILVKSDAEEENVLKETEEEEETEVSEDVNKFATEEEEEEGNSPDMGTVQDDTLPSEKTEEQEFPKHDEDDDNCEALTTENQPDQNEEEEEEKEGKLEVADEASENFDDAASKNSEEMVKTHHEESETFEEQNEVGDEEVTAASGSESGMSSAGNEDEEEEDEEGEEEEKPKVPISELPRIPKRNRREGYRREKSSKSDGPELKSVLGRVDMPEYKMGRSWDKKDSRRSRWDPDDWSQSERDVDCASNRDRKSEGGKSYHSDRSESSRDSEKYPFEYKESKSRKRRRERSRSRSRGRKESAVEYRDIPHRRHSPERSKSRRRDRSRNRSRSGSREKSFDYDKSHKRKSRGRSRDRSQGRKSRRHRSYSRSPSRKRDKERGSADKRRHRDERKRGGEERGHKRHSDKSDPEESRKKRQSHEEYEDWDDGSCQVVDFDESTSPKGTTGKKAADCFYESHSSNEKLNENFFNRRTPQEKGAFKGDKMEESGAFYNARGSSKKHKFVDRFYKAPHMRTVGTEKFPIHLSEDEGDEMGVSSKSHRSEHDGGGQDSGDSEYDPAFPTESGSPLREEAAEEAAKQSEEPAPPAVVVTASAPAVTTAAAVVSAAATEEIASSGPVDETPPSGSQSILGDSGFMIAENPNLQNIPIQPQNITFPMGIRMMPPGMQPGMPQHLLMNPMFLNRPPPFSRLPRISGPVGRLGWSMNPSGIMQIPPNRFGPTRMGPGGGMPPRPGLLNGGFEGMPQEPGQPMPPFKQHPCDPRNIPSHTAGHQGPPGQIPRPGLAGHPPPHMSHIHPPGPLLPHPQQHPPPPPPSSQQMHIPPPTSDTLSSSSLDSQNAPLHMQHGLGKSQPSSDDKSVPSNFCVPELNQITKLLEAHTQALQNKQRNTSSSLQGGDIDVFKIPLPPMAPPSIPPPTLGLPLVPPPDTHNYTSTTKSYKNGQSRLLANSHLSEIASESTEVVDMDVASPLDDEVAIELPASPELDDIDESKINMKDSSVIELSVPEDMPASAVELTNLTNKEKHTSRVKKSNPKASQQRTVSPTSTKTSYMGYMKKLQIQERVVDEVKLAIKPFYSGKKIDKNEYKEILRKAVPKICHSKSGNINPAKIKALIEAYVDKMCKTRRYMERKKKGSLKANGERIKKPSR